MGIFRRAADIFAANMNDLVDRFEEPERMLRQALRKWRTYWMLLRRPWPDRLRLKSCWQSRTPSIWRKLTNGGNEQLKPSTKKTMPWPDKPLRNSWITSVLWQRSNGSSPTPATRMKRCEPILNCCELSMRLHGIS